MERVVSNDGTKRRLPPWMLGVAPVDKGGVGDSKNDSDNRDIDDGYGSKGDQERVKKRGGRKPKVKVAAQEKKRDDFCDGLELEEEKEESSALVVKRCGDRKRTKRKLNLDVEDAPKRKKEKGRGKRNNKSGEDGITGGCLENGEDEDLTVEDLMMFAKECVQGDTGAKEVESRKEDQSVDIVQSDDVEENKRLSGDPTQEINSSAAIVENVNVNATNEASRCLPSMSGDPTQDMLDLLLGPLLKKTQEKEKKVDLTTEEMDFNFEMRSQGTNAVLGKEQTTVTVTKKKTSLRDTVAMFLD